MYLKELSWSPLRNHIFSSFANYHFIRCKPHFPIVTTAFSCFFWVSWYFYLSYLTRGKPRTTLFLSPNTPKAKFFLITALGNFPDNPWLLRVFTHEPKLSRKRVSRVKTLCPCIPTPFSHCPHIATTSHIIKYVHKQHIKCFLALFSLGKIIINHFKFTGSSLNTVILHTFQWSTHLEVCCQLFCHICHKHNC